MEQEPFYQEKNNAQKKAIGKTLGIITHSIAILTLFSFLMIASFFDMNLPLFAIFVVYLFYSTLIFIASRSTSRPLMQGLYQGVKSVHTAIGTGINAVILFVIYALGIGGTALFVKLSRKELLDISKKRKGSYWRRKNQSIISEKTLQQQF